MRTARFIPYNYAVYIRVPPCDILVSYPVRVLLVTVLHRMHAWHLGSRFVLSVQLCSIEFKFRSAFRVSLAPFASGPYLCL